VSPESAAVTPAPDGAALPELDEWTEPLEESGAPTLETGARVESPEGRGFSIVRHLRTERGIGCYEAKGEVPVLLRHASGEAAARLRQEADLLAELDSPSFPTPLAFWEEGETAYLVEAPSEAPSLESALAEGALPLPKLLSVLAQTAHAVARLHAAGWVHLGIRPAALELSRPLRVRDLTYATLIGQRPAFAFHHAGYSAPELLAEGPVDARADVYSIGALLFHAVSGHPIPETGPELSTWEPAAPVAGVPQILHRCLGAPETRYPTMAALHQDLLRLVRRHAPVTRHTIAAATSIGLEPTRRTNQDAYAYLSGAVESEEGPLAWSLLCVSDGMGGMEAGEAASDAAVKRIAAEASRALAVPEGLPVEKQQQLVRDWMQAGNESAVSALEARRARGGATLVCALVVGRRMTVSHVGDCRLYLLRGEEITPLTRDHSLVMSLVMQGQIELEDIRDHPERSTITRSLGDRHPLPDYHIDSLEQVTGSPVMDLQAGDLLLLCSDGLWEPVLEAEMQASIRAHTPDLDSAARDLVRLALERGGPDNIAVLLFRLDQSSQPHLHAAARNA
jgi:protein phosphatase